MSAGATFVLERFTWGAPDRLEVAGRFAGLDQLPTEPAVLVVRGADKTRRLPAVAGGDGQADGRWQAAFAWQEAPAAFDGARLELGDGVAVDLPAPRSRRRPFHKEVLEVQQAGAEEEPSPTVAAGTAAPAGPAGGARASGARTSPGNGATAPGQVVPGRGNRTGTTSDDREQSAAEADGAAAASAPEAAAATADAPERTDGEPDGKDAGDRPEEAPAAQPSSGEPADLAPAERLGLQADLVAARAEARELHAALERATDELVRAREDLEAARAERAIDAQRFRADLDEVRATAEQALTAERAASEEALAGERAEAEQARAAVEASRAAAEEALTAERAAAEAAQAEQASRLQEVEERLEKETEARCAAEAQIAALRERLDASSPAHDELVAVHDDAERLLRRLGAVRDALGG